ncbi:MAG TPA: hypothetical protein VL404_05390 [Candidatus Eisenbacteria bacterium]|nr:hypothetical protein [Candidatus Eisenbacteria bacterium]
MPKAVFIIFGAGAVILGASSPASAVGRYDNLTGIDQSFTLGHDYRTYSETSRDSGVYELTVPEEEKKKTAVREKEEEIKNRDHWLYTRQFGHHSTYDDNIDGTRIDPKGDWSHNDVMTLGMTRKAATNFVQLFYNTSYSYQSENEKAGALTHTGSTKFGYTLGRFALEFGDSYSPSRTFVTGERTELQVTPETKRATSTTNNARLGATYVVSPKTKIHFEYLHDLFYLPAAQNQNSSSLTSGFSTMKHTLTGGVTRVLSPKLTVGADYSWAYVDYYRGGVFDSVTETALLNATGLLTPKTTVSVGLGVYDRRYLGRPVDPRQGTLWSLALSQKLRPKLVATLSARHSAAEELTADSYTRDEYNYGIDLTWKLRPKLQLSFGGDMGFASNGQLLTKPDADNPSLTFTRPDETEQFEYYLALSWHPKPYLSTLLAYECLNQNASFKDGEFEDHKMIGSIEARF